MSKKAEPDFGESAGPALHAARWRFGEFELDESRREFSRNGELLKIEPKPLNLLMLMLRHPGELITKNDLIEALWAGRIVTDAVLSTCVSKLREALGQNADDWLKTVFGFGYRFDCVAELLSDRDAGSEIAAPKLSLEAGQSFPQRPNWQLVRRLGRSGDSWLAEHTKTHARRVFKFTTEPQGLSALKREVTIFRLLRESLGDRISYIELLDWNFDEPPWFIESEYCPGGSLQEWFESQGGVAKVPLATRLDLIAQVADALADVHVIGILHKDLKPANIFVVPNETGAPKIRLADFGSGRLLDSNRLAAMQITRMGFTQMIDVNHDSTSGTPLYLAPEVLAGHPATVKADIYALGVILYQCIVGNLRRPLATGWEQDIDDEMLREDIAAAAEGNPERRLSNAADLAKSLRNLEQRRVVRKAEREAQARLERESRALERMRARRVGLILAFAALAIGFAVSAVLYVDARKARDIALAETRRSEKVAAFLGEDMFKAVNTDDHPVRDLTVKELLDDATAQVPKRFADEPDIAARVYESLGRAYQRLEYDKEAGDNIERALNIHEQRDGPSADDTMMLAESMIRLQYPAGHLPKTIEHYQNIERAGEKQFGRNDPRVLRLRIALARGRVQLGQWAEGESEMLSIYELLQSKGESDSPLALDLETGISYVQMDLAKWSESERHTRHLIGVLSKLRGQNHIDVGDQHARLGRIMYETDRYEDAETELSRAEEIGRQWGRNDGSLLLTIKLYRGWLRLKQKKFDDAIAELLEINKTAENSDLRGFDQSFSVNWPLGLAYYEQKKQLLAIDTLRKALSSAISSLGNNHPISNAIKMSLANIFLDQGKISDARLLIDSSKEMTTENLPTVHPLRIELQRLKETLARS